MNCHCINKVCLVTSLFPLRKIAKDTLKTDSSITFGANCELNYALKWPYQRKLSSINSTNSSSRVLISQIKETPSNDCLIQKWINEEKNYNLKNTKKRKERPEMIHLN